MTFTSSAMSLVLALLAGGAFVLQQAVNASLRVSLQSVAWAGFVSYLGGTLCMVLLAATPAALAVFAAATGRGLLNRRWSRQGS